MAQAAEPLQSLVIPDDYIRGGDIPGQIQSYCRMTGQRIPQSKGEIIRCCLESLALRCAQVLRNLEHAVQPVDRPYMVGGGTRNALLCQFIANAAGKPVSAGPVEASVLGNLLIQWEALGEIRGREQIRELLSRSFPHREYLPQDAPLWREAEGRFKQLKPMSM